MTDKEPKDYCESCSVEPPAMRLKCPECEHNPDKEQIIIDGVDVKNCRRRIGKNNYCRYFKRPCSENNFNCVWKQLARKTQECEDLKLCLQQSKDNNKSTLKLLENKHKALKEIEENDRYRKALEEIEDVYETAMGSVTTYDEQADLNITIEALHNISDIINKARDGK